MVGVNGQEVVGENQGERTGESDGAVAVQVGGIDEVLVGEVGASGVEDGECRREFGLVSVDELLVGVFSA
jgi:hypothetical protein